MSPKRPSVSASAKHLVRAAVLIALAAIASCGSDDESAPGNAGGTSTGGGSGSGGNAGSGGSSGSGATGGASGSAGTGRGGSAGAGGQGGIGGGGSAGTGGSPGDAGGDASNCGPLGEACNGTCAAGFACSSGVCIPESRPTCGGIVAMECPAQFPACVYCSGCDFGPCFRRDELACLCRGAGRSAFRCLPGS